MLLQRPFLISLLAVIAGCNGGKKKSQTSDTDESRVPTQAVTIDAMKAPAYAGTAPIDAAKGSEPTLLLMWSWGENAEVVGTLQGLRFRADHELSQSELAALVASGTSYRTTGGVDEQAKVPNTMYWDCDHFELRALPTTQEDLLVVGSTWPLRPRVVRELKLGPSVRAAAGKALKAMGARSELEIQGANVIDLDGDGKDEYLLSVMHPTLTKRLLEEGQEPVKGDYAGFLVLPGDPAMKPGWIGEVAKDEDPGFASFRLSAVVDLDGDSKLEIVVHGQSWSEGSSVDIFSYSAADLVSIASLGWGEVDCSDKPFEGWGEP